MSADVEYTSQSTDKSEPELRQTPLHDLHVEMGAKMVPFAGYEMPVGYPLGTLKEHLHVRGDAGLFDVSHMGQFLVSSVGDVAEQFEALVPGNIKGLKPGRMRYTQLLNADGGIIDDLMVSRVGEEGGRDWLFLVVNGARKDVDLDHIRSTLGEGGEVQVLGEQALMALQGPKSSEVLETLFPGIAAQKFMSIDKKTHAEFGDVWISRCGYTGEDGFELSCRGDQSIKLARALLAHSGVEFCGLGARDSLRLEAGLCLYGHDIDIASSPVEAGLNWSIGKRRRESGGFRGSERVLAELADGPGRYLVGIQPLGRAPAREGVEILDLNENIIGRITSGGFSPSLGRPIAMGYVDRGFEAVGTKVALRVRGKSLEAEVVDMPFVAHRYYKTKKT